MDTWQAAVCTFGRAVLEDMLGETLTVCIAYLHAYIGTGACDKAAKIYLMWQPLLVVHVAASTCMYLNLQSKSRVLSAHCFFC